MNAEDLQSIYEEMVLYRRFEERANLAYTKRKFSGFLHLHIGQEAVCVGVQRNLRPSDYVIAGYRSHTLAIAKGIEPVAVMSELFGKATGCAKGKGGSMHMFSKEHNFLGGHGIVGGQAPLALGVAYAIKYEERDDVMVCYLGDAAMNQGQVFEAMNMAQTWEVPVLFLIENNRYGMGTDITRTTSIDTLTKRALAFDMSHSQVDGMNVLSVHAEVEKIVKKMREDKKPHLLEAMTYRYKGHSVSDPATYRSKEEVEKYKQIDPITQLGSKLVEDGILTEEELKQIDKNVRAKVKEIEAEADAAPLPEVSSAYDHVFID